MPQEVNYKVKFCEKYFNKNFCDYDINQIDIILYNKEINIQNKYSFKINEIKKKIKNKEDLEIFYNFFNYRDIFAYKINKQLVESGLLLWERENIY